MAVSKQAGSYILGLVLIAIAITSIQVTGIANLHPISTAIIRWIAIGAMTYWV